MKRAALLSLVVLASCPGADDPGPVVVAPPPPKAVARLVSREGTVTLTRGAKTEPAEPGGLQENDVIETGPASKALLRAPGGREIELGENTRFKAGKDLADIEVSEGTISFLAPDMGDGGVVQVTTKFGKTTVAPGTRATLALGDDALSVDVSVGTITQLGDDGGTRSVEAGQKLEFGVGAIEVVDPGTPVKEVELQLVAEGRVLVKKKGEVKPTPAKKGAQPLPAGSLVQVAQGAKARLQLDGLHIKLSGGVNATIESTTSGDDGNEATVALSGPVQLALDGKSKAALKLAGKAPVKVKSKGEAAATLNKSRLEVQLGEVEVESNGKTAVVKAGEVANVTPKGIEVQARARPALVLPNGKKVRVYVKRGLGDVALELPEE
ncbi:MAG: FecR domain-containing protein, partial [Myxococcaceae bacterium]|nr:FecR domain-containing protein [Myxococcaceae bacterium]